MNMFVYYIYVILKLILFIFVTSSMLIAILYSDPLYRNPSLDFIIQEITIDRMIIFYEILAILVFLLSVIMFQIIIRERRYGIRM
jgi:hypothetical protein